MSRGERIFALELGVAGHSQALARRALEDLEAEAGAGRISEMTLLVSELVGNSLRHAGTDADGIVARITVDRLLGGGLRVEVQNHGPDFDPHLHRPEGLGRRLMQGLSSDWGVEEDRNTSIVWFELES